MLQRHSRRVDCNWMALYQFRGEVMNLVACIMRKVECESESVVAKIWKYDKYEN